jgi:5-methylthioadenosine/S-adenosylhomocysteine deaminase
MCKLCYQGMLQNHFSSRRNFLKGAAAVGVAAAGLHLFASQDAFRINKRWFSSSDQLVSMIMGGEVYLGAQTYQQSWTIGRELGLQIAAHILSPFGIRPILEQLALGQGGVGPTGQPPGKLKVGPDNLFIHMTGMSDQGWQAVHDAGAQVSIAFPIEMNMRHGMPPILKMQSLGMEPSLSVDVECTMTADFFTQMRVCMNLQRALVNQMILDQGLPPNPVDWDFHRAQQAMRGRRRPPAYRPRSRRAMFCAMPP